MTVDTDTLGERIAEHVAHIDAAMHLLLTDIREFDQAGGWYRQGFATCAHWLSWRVGWTLGTAREHVRVASKLVDLPHIDEALRQGEMSYSKVRAMTRVATPANEVMLLEEARFTTGQQLEVICQKYAMVQRHGDESNKKDDSERRYVTRRDSPDGMVQIVAALHPEEAATVWAALERIVKEGDRRHGAGANEPSTPVDPHTFANEAPSCAASPAMIASAEVTTPQSPRANDRQSDVPAGTREASCCGERAPKPERSQRFSRADALIVMAEEVVRGTRPDRSPIELVVTIAAESLRAPGTSGAPSDPNTPSSPAPSAPSAPSAPTAPSAPCDPRDAACFVDGTAVSVAAARRLACDAGVVEMVEGLDGTPLSVGRKTRVIPASMKRALVQRDRCCRFPGCTNRLFVEGHHIIHWADGGNTERDNLVTLCGYHHRFLHEYGFEVEWVSSTELRFTDPEGRTVIPIPEPARPAHLGWETIKSRNAPLGITAETPACGWDGARIDLVACIHELVCADDRPGH